MSLLELIQMELECNVSALKTQQPYFGANIGVFTSTLLIFSLSLSLSLFLTLSRSLSPSLSTGWSPISPW